MTTLLSDRGVPPLVGDPKDIDRLRGSYHALYEQFGSNLETLLASLAESAAWQQALVRYYRESLSVEDSILYREQRRRKRAMHRRVGRLSRKFPTPGTLKRDGSESEYALRALAENAWIAVGVLSVRVLRTDEGVVVDVWPLGQESERPIASTYAHFSEAAEDELRGGCDDSEPPDIDGDAGFDLYTGGWEQPDLDDMSWD